MGFDVLIRGMEASYASLDRAMRIRHSQPREAMGSTVGAHGAPEGHHLGAEELLEGMCNMADLVACPGTTRVGRARAMASMDGAVSALSSNHLTHVYGMSHCEAAERLLGACRPALCVIYILSNSSASGDIDLVVRSVGGGGIVDEGAVFVKCGVSGLSLEDFGYPSEGEILGPGGRRCAWRALRNLIGRYGSPGLIGALEGASWASGVDPEDGGIISYGDIYRMVHVDEMGWITGGPFTTHGFVDPEFIIQRVSQCLTAAVMDHVDRLQGVVASRVGSAGGGAPALGLLRIHDTTIARSEGEGSIPDSWYDPPSPIQLIEDLPPMDMQSMPGFKVEFREVLIPPSNVDTLFSRHTFVKPGHEASMHICSAAKKSMSWGGHCPDLDGGKAEGASQAWNPWGWSRITLEIGFYGCDSHGVRDVRHRGRYFSVFRDLAVERKMRDTVLRELAIQARAKLAYLRILGRVFTIECIVQCIVDSYVGGAVSSVQL